MSSTAKARFDYTPSNSWQKNGHTDITLKRSDVISLLGKPVEGWVMAKNETSGKTGYVPLNYIQLEPRNNEAPKSKDLNQINFRD